MGVYIGKNMWVEEMEAMEEAKSSSSLSDLSSITIISNSIVYPHQPSTLGRLNLSVFDIRMLSFHYIQKGLLFTPPSFASSDLINHLRSSLSRALSFFPPLAGRLSTDPDGSFFVDCNDAGVDFVHAVAPKLSLADLADRNSDVPDVTRELFLLNGVVGFEGRVVPLAAVQVTELADGVFVGCSINHGVVDGTSFWDFINAWSELCRGVGMISHPPDFRRTFLEDDPPPAPCIPAAREALVAAPIRDRIFHFSKKALQDLKSRANSSAGGDFNDQGQISSFQALCSQLWRSVTRARKLSPGTETSLRIPANCRHRMDPPLSTHYFGCPILQIVTTAKAEEVVGRELGWCAQLLRRSVAALGDEAVRKAVEKWGEERRPKTMGNTNETVLLVVGSSPRFAVYENDMGWGRPAAVLSGAANRSDGRAWAFPGREGGGSIDLEAILAPETMAGLLSDAEFMQYVSLF